jgi:amino acid transporter
VLTSRIIYGMASYRTLPGFLATVSRRFATPVAASIVVGLLLIGLTWIYMLANSVQNAFNAVIDVSGLLFGSFYILTALATVVYYRRRVLTSVWDALILGILPVLAAFSSPGSSTRRCRAHPRRRTGRWWGSPCSACS